jgi:hypothetical protein
LLRRMHTLRRRSSMRSKRAAALNKTWAGNATAYA